MLWEDPKPEYQAVRSVAMLKFFGVVTVSSYILRVNVASWLRRSGSTDLSHIKDLQAMACCLRSNIHVSVDDFHIAPRT